MKTSLTTDERCFDYSPVWDNASTCIYDHPGYYAQQSYPHHYVNPSYPADRQYGSTAAIGQYRPLPAYRSRGADASSPTGLSLEDLARHPTVALSSSVSAQPDNMAAISESYSSATGSSYVDGRHLPDVVVAGHLQCWTNHGPSTPLDSSRHRTGRL